MISAKTIAVCVATATLCLISGVLGGALSKHFGTSSYTVSYADFISVMLTAISLLMTLLGFFIAILALFGWQSIGTKVGSEVKAYLAEGFKEGNPLHTMLVEQKDKAMFQGVRQVDEEFEQDAAQEDIEERQS